MSGIHQALTMFKPGSSGPIQPDSVSGLLGWWKADAIGGLSDGDPITTWPDSSSNANDMVWANHKALYKTNIQNGLPGVLFNGTSDLFQSANAVTGVRSFFVVAKYTAATFGGFSGLLTFNGALADTFIMLTADSGTDHFYYDSVAVGDPPRVDYMIDTTATVSMTGPMNACHVCSDQSTNYWSAVNTQVRIGVDRQDGSAGRWWTGYVFEVYMYNTVPSSGTRTGLIQYAIDKWAIS